MATTFLYEGKDKNGNATKGEVEANNINAAKTIVRKMGITKAVIKKKGFSFGGGGITPMDTAVFIRQMAVMMKAGVPLLQSFDIVIDSSEKPQIKSIVLKVRNDVASGNSFATALRKFPDVFDDLTCNLIDAGEQSGALESLLDRVASYKEKTERIKMKIKKAMKYPMGVIVVAAIVSAILLIKVVPQFQSVFASFGAELPAFTMFLINLSEFLQEYIVYVVVAIVAIVMIIGRILKYSKAARDFRDKLSLKLPVVGDIMYISAVARFARTLSTTFAAGVPLVDSLDYVAAAAGNVVFVEAMHKIKREVSMGTQLNVSMRASGLFPPLAIAMTTIGEESGALDGMLERVANTYEEEVDNQVDGLTDLMEPLIMAVLGVIVGGLVIGMYLPIFSMGSVV